MDSIWLSVGADRCPLQTNREQKQNNHDFSFELAQWPGGQQGSELGGK